MSRNPEIPKPLGKKTIIHKNGDTDDIIDVILLGERRFEQYGADFCQWANANFKATKEGLSILWKYVRNEFKYKVDPSGKQWIKTPPALASTGKGDCKSKTLFVNAVLRCLGIKYKIRFTSYDKNDPTIKHVYTVAYLDGEEIIIDSVYRKFNQEVAYKHKRDFDMAEIAIIEGLENQELVPTYGTNGSCSPLTEAYAKGKEEGIKRREVILQKQKHIKEFEPVEFSKLSEGQASLQLLEREIKILQVMKPEMSRHMEKALAMVQKARKGDCSIVGDIPKELYRYAAKIQQASKGIRKANSFGISTKRINYLRQFAGKKCNSIGAITFPGRQCLNGLWRHEVNGNYTAQTQSGQHGFCDVLYGASIYDLLDINRAININNQLMVQPGQMPLSPPTQAQLDTLKSNVWLQYGANTDHRVSFEQYGQAAKNELDRFVTSGVLTGENDGSYWFSKQADFDLVIETINANSGVKDNWINDAFATGTKGNPNKLDTGTGMSGSLGTGMLYSFANQVQDIGISGVLPVSAMPTQVQIKKAAEDTFLYSCVNFSGVSFSNTQQLARQGILFDNGGDHPEATLLQLYRLSKGDTSAISGIGTFGIAETITLISAIVAALVTVTAAVGDAVAKANAAALGADAVDPNLATSSAFRPPGLQLMPSDSDWQDGFGSGGGNGGGNGDGSGSSNLLPIAALAAAGYLYTQGDEKKKKKKN